ncbi:MAG: oxidoreductase [Chloroflexota bacterium]|nr:oxidoreductase [Chloroflexota bacterium]
MLMLPLGIVWFAAVGVAFLDGRRRPVGWSAVAALSLSLLALLWLGADVWRTGPVEEVGGNWPLGYGITLRADALGVLFAILSVAVLLAALVYETLGTVRTRTFPALVLFMATGLIGLFLTGDAFNFYVFFEIAMVSAYVLTSYGERSRQLRAAMIFAVVNLLGSVFFLISVTALYHVTGSLDMQIIAVRLTEVDANPAILTAATLFVAFGIKLGLFPFHFWLPAVYTGTRPAVAAILSGALANIGSYGLLRFGAGMLSRELELAGPALFILGTASIVYGALQAISRRDVGEVLAYSAIGQVGYILIALGVGGPIGYAAAILYAVINAVNKTLLFLTGSLRGWPVGAAFVVGAFSVAGVPPAAGFLGKAALFRTGVEETGPVGGAVLVTLVFIGGALSFIYMFQLYQRRFWVALETMPGATSLPARRVLVVVLAAVVLTLGVWPEPLLLVSERAAAVLAEDKR